MAAGTAWENLDLVFANEIGRALSPSEVTSVYHRRVLNSAVSTWIKWPSDQR